MRDVGAVEAVGQELNVRKGDSVQRHHPSSKSVIKYQLLYGFSKAVLGMLYATAILMATTIGLIGLTIGLQFTLSLPLLVGLLAASAGLFCLAMLRSKTRINFSEQLDEVLGGLGLFHATAKGKLIDKRYHGHADDALGFDALGVGASPVLYQQGSQEKPSAQAQTGYSFKDSLAKERESVGMHL